MAGAADSVSACETSVFLQSKAFARGVFGDITLRHYDSDGEEQGNWDVGDVRSIDEDGSGDWYVGWALSVPCPDKYLSTTAPESTSLRKVDTNGDIQWETSPTGNDPASKRGTYKLKVGPSSGDLFVSALEIFQIGGQAGSTVIEVFDTSDGSKTLEFDTDPLNQGYRLIDFDMDGSDNVYVLSSVKHPLSPRSSWSLSKWSSTGDPLWGLVTGVFDSDNMIPTSLVYDSTGVYVTRNVFITKYDNPGAGTEPTLQWDKSTKGYTRDFVIDGTDLYQCHHTQGTGFLGPYSVDRHTDLSGVIDFDWGVTHGVNRSAIDADDDVYVAGSRGKADDDDAENTHNKLTTSGELAWSKDHGNEMRDVKILSDGTVLFGGQASKHCVSIP